ncbi:hypothetical protein Tco_1376248 [Tanacetum coccineum]
MTTLAEFMIIAGADNRPPMLEKSMHESWKSRMELYMENKENGRMILDSVQNGPLVGPTIVDENGSRVGVDTAYPVYWIRRIGVSWSRTTFDIFQNIHILYLQYGVLVSLDYGHIESFSPSGLW